MNALAYATPAVADGESTSPPSTAACAPCAPRTAASFGKPSCRGGSCRRLVVGDLVFVSSLDHKTFGLARGTGKVVWRTNRGRYAPGIATDRSTTSRSTPP